MVSATTFACEPANQSVIANITFSSDFIAKNYQSASISYLNPSASQWSHIAVPLRTIDPEGNINNKEVQVIIPNLTNAIEYDLILSYTVTQTGSNISEAVGYHTLTDTATPAGPPSQPTITVSPINATSMEISFSGFVTNGADITKHSLLVYDRTADTFNTITSSTSPITLDASSNPPIVANHMYEITAQVINEMGASPFSASIDATAVVSAPAPTLYDSDIKVSSNSAEFLLDTPSAALKYIGLLGFAIQIKKHADSAYTTQYFKVSSNGTSTLVPNATSTSILDFAKFNFSSYTSSSISLLVPNLDSNYAYDIKIAYISDYGVGSYTGIIAVQPTAIPSQINNLIVKRTLADSADGDFVATWDAPTDNWNVGAGNYLISVKSDNKSVALYAALMKYKLDAVAAAGDEASYTYEQFKSAFESFISLYNNDKDTYYYGSVVAPSTASNAIKAAAAQYFAELVQAENFDQLMNVKYADPDSPNLLSSNTLTNGNLSTNVLNSITVVAASYSYSWSSGGNSHISIAGVIKKYNEVADLIISQQIAISTAATSVTDLNSFVTAPASVPFDTYSLMTAFKNNSSNFSKALIALYNEFSVYNTSVKKWYAKQSAIVQSNISANYNVLLLKIQDMLLYIADLSAIQVPALTPGWKYTWGVTGIIKEISSTNSFVQTVTTPKEFVGSQTLSKIKGIWDAITLDFVSGNQDVGVYTTTSPNNVVSFSSSAAPIDIFNHVSIIGAKDASILYAFPNQNITSTLENLLLTPNLSVYNFNRVTDPLFLSSLATVQFPIGPTIPLIITVNAIDSFTFNTLSQLLVSSNNTVPIYSTPTVTPSNVEVANNAGEILASFKPFYATSALKGTNLEGLVISALTPAIIHGVSSGAVWSKYFSGYDHATTTASELQTLINGLSLVQKQSLITQLVGTYSVPSFGTWGVSNQYAAIQNTSSSYPSALSNSAITGLPIISSGFNLTTASNPNSTTVLSGNNGTSYVVLQYALCSVTTTSNIKTYIVGGVSVASVIATPSTIPSLTALTNSNIPITEGNQQLEVKFKLADVIADNGGTDTTSVTVSLVNNYGDVYPNNTKTVNIFKTTTDIAVVFTGLTNGLTYKPQLVASNINGNSTAKISSGSAIPFGDITFAISANILGKNASAYDGTIQFTYDTNGDSISQIVLIGDLNDGNAPSFTGSPTEPITVITGPFTDSSYTYRNTSNTFDLTSGLYAIAITSKNKIVIAKFVPPLV